MIHHKPIDQIDATDIQELVDQEQAEGRTLDNKEFLPGDSDEASAHL